MEVGMECFICGTESAQVLPSGDYKQLVCPECGEYKISDTAIQTMKNNNYRFDVDLARRWLAMQLGSGTIPLIGSDRAASLI
jgi:predicted RNA-binding Zn-ribbon protein involved in translation (DUF1610 family)